jgi:hypothetical protein
VKRTTEKQIVILLKRWSSLRGKKERIEAERDQAIQPIRARFEQRCAPILDKAQVKLDPLLQEISDLQRQIEQKMLEGFNEDGLKVRRIDAATCFVEVVTKSQREIDPKEFFEAIPQFERGQAFWACLKILIGNAEKFLGNRINELAHARQSHSVSILHK